MFTSFCCVNGVTAQNDVLWRVFSGAGRWKNANILFSVGGSKGIGKANVKGGAMNKAAQRELRPISDSEDEDQDSSRPGRKLKVISDSEEEEEDELVARGAGARAVAQAQALERWRETQKEQERLRQKQEEEQAQLMQTLELLQRQAQETRLELRQILSKDDEYLNQSRSLRHASGHTAPFPDVGSGGEGGG